MRPKGRSVKRSYLLRHAYILEQPATGGDGTSGRPGVMRGEPFETASFFTAADDGEETS
jgi:hypothetical protein